ncbi:MAG: ABC transporter ATP-binding protein [Deltaproteobacteria bacterium]|nr:MAG: ABC transporter ATP-binding protein [Deltaproteobacteria bacterium]TNF28075.1 MAG: ABC transporter ATP-binding protein [Deltaproteobacteria bacterium]
MILTLIKRLVPYVKPHKGKVIGSILFSFALAGIKFCQAYMVKPIFDKGLSEQASFNEAMILAGILLGLGLLNFPARFFHFYWIRYVVDRATCSVRSEIFKKLQRLPMTFYSKSKQGKLISNLLNDTATFSQGFRGSVDILREPLTAIFMFGLALYRDWQLTLIIILVAPLFVLIFSKSGKKVRRNQGDVQEEASHLTHTIGEGISGYKITKAFNLENFQNHRFEGAQDRFFNSLMRTTFVEEMAHPFVELVGAIAFSGVILFAHHRIHVGGMTTGDFISFITALALLMDPIRKYSQANVKINQALAAGERIFDLLQLPEEVDNGKIESKKFEKSIEVKNLTFSYGEGDVIRDLSLKINKGEKVALVGLSGSGKSTLVNLLLGLYRVDRGVITIDDEDILDYKLDALRSLSGLVSQDIFLFHDTIKENLCLGKEFTDEQIQKALEVAYADEFVNKLPKGIETVIGDRGTRLSGGQQQRITIARAFLQDTDILLFDEATSALDNESEKVVQKALERLAGSKTVIAVAHRLSTIQDFDKIFVLHEGKLVESGTHKELMQHNGEYAKLYDLSQKI